MPRSLPRSVSNPVIALTRLAPLHRINDPASKVLEQIGNIPDGVTVRKEVPAAGAVAVVIEPRAEDEVGGDKEEEAARR